jgi:hypothetical protein
LHLSVLLSSALTRRASRAADESSGADDERNVIGLCLDCHRLAHAAVVDAHA